LYPMLGNEPYSPRQRSNFSLRFNQRILFLPGSRKRHSGAKKQMATYTKPFFDKHIMSSHRVVDGTPNGDAGHVPR
jgi:hypothetical protein